MTVKRYAERDAMALDEAGSYYIRHVMAMTSEGLHSKGDIAAELGWRDMQIDALQQQVNALAAEANALREQSEDVYASGYNHGHLNTVDGIAYGPLIKDEFYHNALQVMAEVETPTTDAAIRELQAQGVDKFIQSLNGATELWHPCDAAEEFAATLRNGEQGGDHV